jgi:hypothetical protein
MSGLVDIALPAKAQKAAEALGARYADMTGGAWVHWIPRDEDRSRNACVIGVSSRASPMIEERAANLAPLI